MSAVQANKAENCAKRIVLLGQHAGFEEAKKIVENNYGRLPTIEDFIHVLEDPVQYDRFKGTRYWLSDEGRPNVSGCCKVDYRKGCVVEVPKDEYRELNIHEQISVHEGKGPPALIVGYYGLVLLAVNEPHTAAQVAMVKLHDSEKQVKRIRDTTAKLTKRQ